MNARTRHRPWLHAAATTLRGAALVLGGLAAVGCDDGPRVGEYPIRVVVHGDPGKVVSGAAVLRNQKELGASDLAGIANVTLRGNEGDSVDVTVRCPAGYESPRKALSVRLKKGSESQRLPEYAASCTPAIRQVVVAIRAESGGGMPVTYLGRPVGRTDASGVAHVLLRMHPGDQFELGLDTSQFPKHRPQNPKASFLVSSVADEVQRFDVRFDVERPKPVARFVAARPTRL